MTPLGRALLDEYQAGFPLVPRPFAAIAERLGVTEAEVIETLRTLQATGAVGRVGAVIAPHRAGWSTLSAMAVPDARLDEVAALVTSFPEVNHNYEREHRLNLWFVVTATDRNAVMRVLEEISRRSDVAVVDLPLEEAYHIDLGFPLQWS
jgi:DNA-binding Lrp family transcriptional regulator